MSDLDRLRRDAASLGYVLLPTEQAETIVHNVSGLYREKMEENAQAMDSLAAALRAGEQVPMWAPGEQGARAADSLARQFRQQATDMAEIAQACEGILMQDDSRNVTLSYTDSGYVVNDYEHNMEEFFTSERDALPYYNERVAAVQAMATGREG